MSYSPAKRRIRKIQDLFFYLLKSLPEKYTLLIYNKLKPISSLMHLYIVLHNNNL